MILKKIISGLSAGIVLLGLSSLLYAASMITHNLSVGSTGSEVAILQTALEQSGFLNMPQGIQKGYFGNTTKEALKKYQKLHGISQTGIVGPVTRAFLAQKASGGVPVMTFGTSTSKGMSPTVDLHANSIASTSLPQNQQISTSFSQGSTGSLESEDPRNVPVVTSVNINDPISVCDTKSEGDSCWYMTSNNKSASGMCRDIQEQLVCIPLQ